MKAAPSLFNSSSSRRRSCALETKWPPSRIEILHLKENQGEESRRPSCRAGVYASSFLPLWFVIISLLYYYMIIDFYCSVYQSELHLIETQLFWMLRFSLWCSVIIILDSDHDLYRMIIRNWSLVLSVIIMKQWSDYFLLSPEIQNQLIVNSLWSKFAISFRFVKTLHWDLIIDLIIVSIPIKYLLTDTIF